MKAMADREVWFITGSQALYGDEVLRQVADHAAEIARALDNSDVIPVRVVGVPAVTTSDAIRRVLLEATAADACIGASTWMHTFSPPGIQIPRPALAAQAAAPPAHAAQSRPPLGGDRHGLHEPQPVGAWRPRVRLHREALRRPRTVVVGHWRDPEVVDRIGAWTRAASGVHELQRLRLARFGDNMRQVAVTEGDKVEAQIRLGARVDGYGVGDLVAAVHAASDTEVDQVLDAYDASYDMAPPLRREGERRPALREAARIEVGLRTFLTAGGFGAFTDTFEDLGALVQLPGIAVQRLMADGYGFGAEGDWKTALLVRAMKVMATGLPGGTSFMEDYTYHLVPDRPQVLGAHMLEVCPSIADGTPTCEIHPLAIGNRADPVRLVFTAGPGPAVVTGLLDLGDRFRLVLNEIDVVRPPEDLPRLPVARALWEPRPSLKVAAETWILAGGPHHTSLSSALTRVHIEDFAEMAGIELIVIGDGTTGSDIRKELRWNETSYAPGHPR